MDIFERDLSGEMLDPSLPEFIPLKEAINECVALADELNSGHKTNVEVHEIMDRILGSPLPESTTIMPPFYIDYGRPVTIGEDCFFQQCITVYGRGGITIGNGVLIGAKASLVTIGHDINPERRHCTYCRPIVIEDKVWIGASATILPGVKLGYGCIVGANSVVTRDVEPMTIVAGSPARVIKKIEKK